VTLRPTNTFLLIAFHMVLSFVSNAFQKPDGQPEQVGGLLWSVGVLVSRSALSNQHKSRS
jgi:hypothetical protein